MLFLLVVVVLLMTKIRKEILKNHFSFWLNWDESILIRRIKDSKKRPLVFKSTDQEIRTIIKKDQKYTQMHNLK